MNTKHFLAASFTLIGLASAAFGQGMMAPTQGSPRISHIMPIGGQAGTTFDLKVTGQDLKDVEGLHFNFPGVKVQVEGSEVTPVEKKGKPAPPLNSQKFKVTLPANAPIGIQDVRIVTKAGISNPRAFVVSDHKEFAEEEPNDDVPKAQRIELNSSVSGVISVPTDVDYYVFAGKKGQRVICSVLSTSVDSRLPALIQLFTATDNYLGSNRSYSQNDAVVDAVLPADGDYYVRICSFSYTQGGIDYFYRLTVSTAPWIDAVFPSVVEAGKEAQVTVYGRNLPGGKLDPDLLVNDRPLEKAVVTVKASADPMALQRLAFTGFMMPPSSMLDGFDHRLKNASGQSNPFLMTYASAPVVLDSGDNDTQDKAQQLPMPCVIAGRIEKKADKDWYAF
ncbi:MAG: PPC domain-containing protein, partial [Planctomycetes bacterium]|nr:PPC domain-containing protein [Planctomycetota bacterium]